MSFGFCLAYYQTSFHTVVTVQVGTWKNTLSIDTSDKAIYAVCQCRTVLAFLRKTGHRPLDSVQKAFSTLHHQLLLLDMRTEVYERQLAVLREQVAQIEDLKAELAELRERLGQNSNNSSKPPSSDPPHQLKTTSNESKDRK